MIILDNLKAETPNRNKSLLSKLPIQFKRKFEELQISLLRPIKLWPFQQQRTVWIYKALRTY
jgi:hypothetical protein